MIATSYELNNEREKRELARSDKHLQRADAFRGGKCRLLLGQGSGYFDFASRLS